MALGFQRQHQLCPIQMGTDSNSGRVGSDEDTDSEWGGGEGGCWVPGRRKMKRGERKARKAKRDCEEKGGGRRRGDGVCYDEGNKRTGRKANKRLSGRVRPVNLFVDT